MALNPLISLQAQAPDVGQAIGQGLQNVRGMQQIREQPLRNRLLETQAGVSELGYKKMQEEDEARSILMGIDEALTNLESGGRSAEKTGLYQRRDEILSRNGNPSDTDYAISSAEESEQMGEPESDYIPRKKQELIESRNKIWAAYPSLIPESEKQRRQVMAEVNKETRANLNQNLPKFDEKFSGLELNYKKIAGLEEAISKDNRMAVAQGIIAMVKLGEPNSAVLESEMRAALNQQDPLAAVITTLQGAGVNGLLSNETLSKLMVKLDPLSPANVNGRELLDVANTVADASLGTLEGEYRQYQEQGRNLSDYSKSSLFTKEREERLGGLRQRLTDWRKNTPPLNAVKEQNIKTGEVRWKLPDGSIWRPQNG